MKKGGKKPTKKPDYPMNCQQFYEWTKLSPTRHIQIIGEWADTTKHDFRTYYQWQTYITRYVRTAKLLEAFSREQMMQAFGKIEMEQKKGWLTKVTLETLLKFLT